MLNKYNINRREFLKRLLLIGGSALIGSFLLTKAGCKSPETEKTGETPVSTVLDTENPVKPKISHAEPSDSLPHLVVVRGKNPEQTTRKAIEALGGIERFVKPQSVVVIKPNICVGYRTYEYAATTNPQVVSTLIRLCKDAGAKKVSVMDMPFGGTPMEAYKNSGIEDAVKQSGGEMHIMQKNRYRDLSIPSGSAIKSWPVYEDILNADVLINVPIAKHHSSARLTIAMKNLLGTVQGPNKFHMIGLHQCIADLNTALKPTLNVIDATRILVRGGPTGGRLDDVKEMNTIIASEDIVAADAYAATLFGLQATQIEYILLGAKAGCGEIDLNKLNIKEINA